ncbi:hypothetical protein JCM14450A_13260 [Geobacillus stearothermophilus]
MPEAWATTLLAAAVYGQGIGGRQFPALLYVPSSLLYAYKEGDDKNFRERDSEDRKK